MALEDERFGITRNEAIKLQMSPYVRPPKRAEVMVEKRLERLDAPWFEVLTNTRYRNFHAQRFINGAYDDLALDAWCDMMDERQADNRKNERKAR
jgi:hypothetical protein